MLLFADGEKGTAGRFFFALAVTGSWRIPELAVCCWWCLEGLSGEFGREGTGLAFLTMLSLLLSLWSTLSSD